MTPKHRTAKAPPNKTKRKTAKSSALDKLYWLLPIVLSILQLVYILASNNQIRTEELAESIRNVFWLDQGLIYDGVSSNVGYYGLLLIVYKLFGFSIHAAKYVRLVIYFAAMYSLAAVLRNLMQTVPALIILTTIGLSPTILFFDTIQTSFGMDVLYGIICLLMLLNMQFDGCIKDLALAFGLGFIAMLAAMSYPAFLPYLPSLAILYVYGWWSRNSKPRKAKQVVVSAFFSTAGFSLPLVIALSYLKDPRKLLNDPVTGAGLFRGGGKLHPNIQSLGNSVYQSLADILQQGTSYYYYLQHPDFSGWPIWIAGLIALGLGVFIAVKKPGLRFALFLAGFHTLLNLLLPSFAPNLPGIRRSTGLLFGLYAFYAVVVFGLFTETSLKNLKWAGAAACVFFTVSNLTGYWTNMVAVALPVVPYADTTWFAAKETPSRSLQYWLAVTAKGMPLKCYDAATRSPVPCQYATIYAAIAGYRHWNGLPEIPVIAYDWKTQENRNLSPDLWETYYFPH